MACENCLPRTARLILLIANFNNIIGGILIVACGIWLFTGASGATSAIAQLASNAAVPIVVVIAGVLLLLAGIIGFVAAKYANKVLLCCFGCLMFVTLVIVLAVTVLSLSLNRAVDKPEFPEALDTGIKTAMSKKPETICEAYKALQCSGGSKSCFAMGFPDTMCPVNCPAATDPWAKVDCHSRIVAPIRSWSLLVGVVGAIWCSMLVVGLIFVCCVCCYTKKKGPAGGPQLAGARAATTVTV
eukprot:tig00020904_g15166.t1